MSRLSALLQSLSAPMTYPWNVYPHYTSTYCIHGLHEDCRLTCKVCAAPCKCSCHLKGQANA